MLIDLLDFLSIIKVEVKQVLKERGDYLNKLLKIKNFIPNYIKAMRDKDTPVLAKILGILTIIYALVPSDMIPDLIPFFGVLDDAIVLPFLIYLSTKMIDKKKLHKVNNDSLEQVID